MSELQKKKNIRLVWALVGLMVITSLVYFFDTEGDKTNINKDLFSIGDVQNIDKIVIDRVGTTLTIAYDKGKWTVNGVMDADMSRIDVLFAIINQVKVRRAVAKNEVELVKRLLKKEGNKVSVYEGDKLVKSFFAGGNEDKSQAYFMDVEGDPYVVNIPGYQSYVSGIFEMREKDWRNRLIFASNNWLTLDKLSLSYLQEPNSGFDIVFDNNNLYRIAQVNESDTAKMYNFMEAVSFLQVYDYIQPGEYPQYDSLQQLSPRATLSLSDVSANNIKLDFYPKIDRDNYVLGVVDSVQAVLFDHSQLKNVLRKRKDFLKTQ